MSVYGETGCMMIFVVVKRWGTFLSFIWRPEFIRRVSLMKPLHESSLSAVPEKSHR